jgi:hypothetical protein
VVNRFLRHPEFVPLFYAELKRMIETTFSAGEIEPLFDQALGDWGAAAGRPEDERTG